MLKAHGPAGLSNVHLDGFYVGRDAAINLGGAGHKTASFFVEGLTVDTQANLDLANLQFDDPNIVPEAVGTLDDVAIREGESSTVGLAEAFSDADGDPLTYEVVEGPAFVLINAVRLNKLWLVVESVNVRRYLLGYLKLPQWTGKTWDDIKNQVILPYETDDLNIFFVAEQQRRTGIQMLLDEVAQIDAEIDEKVLD